MATSLTAPLVDALHAWLDGMDEFEPGRVGKRDLRALQPDEPGYQQGKPGAAVWGNGMIASQALGGISGQAEITTGILKAIIQVGMTFDGSAERLSAYAALVEAVETRLLDITWATGPWFNIEIALGADPPRWSRVVDAVWSADHPDHAGLITWIGVSVKKI